VSPKKLELASGEKQKKPALIADQLSNSLKISPEKINPESTDKWEEEYDGVKGTLDSISCF